jgi:23S rRNA (cytosine1962-C5)-methyltransferase
MLQKREIIYLNKGQEKQNVKGFPWVFREQISNLSTLMLLEPGEQVFLAESSGKIIGTGYANPKAQIVIRLMELKKYDGAFDEKYFAYKIGNALKRREKHYSEAYYRLVFSEADFLPGLVIDRFGDTISMQISTTGMEIFQPQIFAALEAVLQPKNIIIRNDIPVRTKEGLTGFTSIVKGEIPDLLEVNENNFTYLADLKLGQKTGWFYDMRENRQMITNIAKENNCKTMLDAFCYTGGFGLLAANNGIDVTLLDSSERALNIARQTAEKANLQNIEYVQDDVVDGMRQFAFHGKKFDLIVLDPPPYSRSKEDRFAAANGYRKLVYQALPVLNDGGIIFLASCSYNSPMQTLKKAVSEALKGTGKNFEILHQTHASLDHPFLSILPQLNYLSAITFRVT